MKVGAILVALALAISACGGGAGEDSNQGGGVAAGDVGRDDLEFCDRAAQAAEILDEAEEFDFADALALLQKVADGAPSEIDGDLELVIEAFRQFVAFTEDGTEPTIDEAEIDAASARLDRYFTDVCGFENEDDAGASGVAPAGDDSFDEVDVATGTFEGAGLTLDLSGAVNASDNDYDPFDVECTLWENGDFWLVAFPDDDQWSIEVNAADVPGLEVGSWDTYHASAYPPFDSEEGQSGLFLTGEAGTITVDDIGPVRESDEGLKTAELSGRFEVQMSQVDDPSAEVAASGTFACLATMYEL